MEKTHAQHKVNFIEIVMARLGYKTGEKQGEIIKQHRGWYKGEQQGEQDRRNYFVHTGRSMTLNPSHISCARDRDCENIFKNCWHDSYLVSRDNTILYLKIIPTLRKGTLVSSRIVPRHFESIQLHVLIYHNDIFIFSIKPPSRKP